MAKIHDHSRKRRLGRSGQLFSFEAKGMLSSWACSVLAILLLSLFVAGTADAKTALQTLRDAKAPSERWRVCIGPASQPQAGQCVEAALQGWVHHSIGGLDFATKPGAPVQEILKRAMVAVSFETVPVKTPKPATARALRWALLVQGGEAGQPETRRRVFDDINSPWVSELLRQFRAVSPGQNPRPFALSSFAISNAFAAISLGCSDPNHYTPCHSLKRQPALTPSDDGGLQINLARMRINSENEAWDTNTLRRLETVRPRTAQRLSDIFSATKAEVAQVYATQPGIARARSVEMSILDGLHPYCSQSIPRGFPGLFYERQSHSILVCPAAAHLPKPALMAFFAHELGHSFSACSLAHPAYRVENSGGCSPGGDAEFSRDGDGSGRTLADRIERRPIQISEAAGQMDARLSELQNCAEVSSPADLNPPLEASRTNGYQNCLNTHPALREFNDLIRSRKLELSDSRVTCEIELEERFADGVAARMIDHWSGRSRQPWTRDDLRQAAGLFSSLACLDGTDREPSVWPGYPTARERLATLFGGARASATLRCLVETQEAQPRCFLGMPIDPLGRSSDRRHVTGQ